MQYHEIGKTGMKVSSLSFGASSLGGVSPIFRITNLLLLPKSAAFPRIVPTVPKRTRKPLRCVMNI